ncbi:pickpocket protein 28 [Hyposmocoma kahamanoa]|uniref:pickpocket protein 28 n=1 Tax=Hyposmocoma kahamanoa TaxID=1477025 RepID=UPI000E6D9610|nr:pickpocket protein 28 [Hyposmocoma kahamanoa]
MKSTNSMNEACNPYDEEGLRSSFEGTDEEIHTLKDISLVCGEVEEIEMIVGNTFSYSIFTNSSLVQNFLKVAPDVEDVFAYCMWRGQYVDCRNIFKVAVTLEGVCYNFNALAASEMFTDRYQSTEFLSYSYKYQINEINSRMQKDYPILNTTEISRNWTVTEGYTNTDEHPYPRRGRENGPSPDLVVGLKEDKRFSGSACNSMRNGFKIFVQTPEDLPQSSHYYYAALQKQVSSVAVKFNMLNTSETLRGYDPEVRQCYFPEDYKLDYFKVYTPSNCRLECQSKYTFKKCGCVWFNMPHRKGTPICTGRLGSCVSEAQDELAMGALEADLGLPDNGKACRCLPSCYSIQYDAEILKTSFDVQNYFKHLEVIMNDSFPWINDYEHSRIEMYFKEPRFVSMRRSELFGLTDFLANVGGLLGLFLGFSLLSLVEIVYFVTLRLCCILKRDLRQEKLNSEIKDEKLS